VPKTSDMRESKFLKQSDIGRGVLGTVDKVVQMNVAAEGVDPEMKWCLTFVELEKPLVLNSTNIQLAEKIFQSDDTDHWRGKQVVLYVDPNVSYQGKLVGGIRLRAKKVVAAPAPPPPAPPLPATGEIYDDDIPF
jgi:hypothetical protein